MSTDQQLLSLGARLWNRNNL